LPNDAQKSAYVGAYKISKAMVNAHARLLQKELNETGFSDIRVAAIDPGW
jgi:NAD(P)-dependent dehydrogenase (short-subunit alcohol dehydrogenase family)